nr:VWA domain-containing protein [Candidatus Saccharibacteria bacterium]
MSLKSRFRNVAAAFLMVLSTVAPMGNGLLLNAYAEGSNDAPAHGKTLKPNGDGTYNLSLSVTGTTQSSQTSEVTKANVILVMDTSSSMNINAGNTYYPVVGIPSDPSQDGNSTPTYYRLNGSNYQQVYYRNGQWYTERNGGQQFSGQFYCRSRLWAEKNTLTKTDGIIDELLKQNVAGDSIKSDIIEVAVVSFGMDGEEQQSFTTNSTTLKNSINGLTTDSGTNWEEALQVAKSMADTKKAAQPNEDMYIIFLTDGQPSVTATNSTIATGTTGWNNAWTAARDDARSLVTSGYKFYSLFTWGDSTYEHYLTSLVNYAYSGTGSYNSGIGSYGDYYTNADSTDALIAALAQIVHNITNSVGYTDVEFIDEVTEMTSTSISSAVDGTATGFRYTRSGGSYGSGQEWTNAPEAKVVDGKVHWDLGDMILENGVTYTVSFTVWPSQESFDLVADLNNKLISYDSLDEDTQKQIIKVGDNYYLKTNTDFPTLSYSTITTTTVDGQSSTKITPHDPINITNPDPVDLAEKKVTLEKLWEDSLDPSQRDEICDEDGTCEVTLDLTMDGKPYLSNIVLSKDNGWKISDYLAIAPGVMVSEGSDAYSTNYPIVTIDGVKYAILETGHDYEFSEQDINNHFELTNYRYHPMLKDGELRNIRFTKDAAGNVTGIEKDDPIMSSISAT